MAEARLPDRFIPPYVAPRESLSRPGATALSRAATKETALTVTGSNQVIPVTQGEDRISGLWIVRPYTHVGTGQLRFAILWGWGPAEGVQQIFINGADAPGGVLMTHYTGEPGQGVDPILAADIPGFGDKFEGCAYTVFRVPPATITGFPQTAQIEAVFRGKKQYDPRAGVTAWSRNPALAIRDFVTDTRYGPGIPIRGIEAVADRCDSLVGGVEIRCQIGLTISEGRYLDQWLDVLCTYAECLWSYDGDGILVVPDAPAEIAAVIDSNDVVENSYRFPSQGLSSAPTVVTVTCRPSTGTAEQWLDEPAIQKLPGVDTGEVPEIRSDIPMPGTQRISEGNRKALYRLRRLQLPAPYAWQMYDRGVKFQRGDVVQLPDQRGLSSWLVRVLSKEMVALGKYQITAERYLSSIYPDEVIPGSETVVPVGGVLPFLGSEAPSGYEMWHKADGLLLCGSDTQGAEEGDTTFVVSGETGDSPPHTGDTNDDKTADGFFHGVTNIFPGSSKPAGQAAALPHRHNYTSMPIAHTPIRRSWRLIKKTGSAGAIPANAGVYANGALISARMEEVASSLGRLVLANSSAAPANSGTSNTRSINITMNSTGSHGHGALTRGSTADATFAQPPIYYYQQAGNHNHNGSITVNVSLRRRRMAVYIATADSDVAPGAVIGWDSEDEPPSGWNFCNGSNGTVDLINYFLEHSGSATAGEEEGDNTVNWSTVTKSAGKHNHKGALAPNATNERLRHSKDDGGHVHPVSGSVPFLPPRYLLRFIQYTGVE